MRHFLLVYDVAAGRLVAPPLEFKDAGAALFAYSTAEEMHRLERYMQVVLIASDSLDTVKLTHGNFFESETVTGMIRRLVDPAPPVH